jgi:hypothetical protein
MLKIKIAYSNAKEIRDIKKLIKKNQGKKTSDSSDDFATQVEDTVFAILSNLPGGRNFDKKAVEIISDSLLKDSILSNINKALIEESSNYLYQKGLDLIIESEENLSSRKKARIGINKLFVDIRDVSVRALRSSGYSREVANLIKKDMPKRMTKEEFIDIVCKHSLIQKKTLPKSIFESSYRHNNSRLLLEDQDFSSIFSKLGIESNAEFVIKYNEYINPSNDAALVFNRDGIITFSDGTPLRDGDIPSFAEELANNANFKEAHASGVSEKLGDYGDSAIGSLKDLSLTLLTIKAAYYGYEAMQSIQKLKSTVKKENVNLKEIEKDFTKPAAVLIANILCDYVLSEKDKLKEKGIEIQGSPAYRQAKVDEGTDDKVSSELLGMFKNTKKWGIFSRKGANKKSISDSDIISAIKDPLTTIAIGIMRKYDKESYDNAIKYADKQSFVDARSSGFNPFTWFRSKKKDDVINRISGKKIKKGREKYLQQSVKKDVDLLAKFIVGFSNRVKGIEETFIHNDPLLSLLFEDVKSNKQTVPVEDLKKGLESLGVLIYGSDIKPGTKEFANAENYLVGTMASFMNTNFDISVQGVDQYKKLNLDSVEVESTVNKDAKPGEIASEEIAALTKAAGVPEGTDSPFDMKQMLMLMNMCGGNPMIVMMMLMMKNPQILNNMFKMQNSGDATLKDGINLLKDKAEGDELSDLDRDIENAIKVAQKSFPAISTKLAKRFYKTLSNITNNDIPDHFDIKRNDARNNDTNSFVYQLKQYFKIQKEESSIDQRTFEALRVFLQRVFVVEDLDFEGNIFYYDFYTILANKLLNQDKDFKFDSDGAMHNFSHVFPVPSVSSDLKLAQVSKDATNLSITGSFLDWSDFNNHILNNTADTKYTYKSSQNDLARFLNKSSDAADVNDVTVGVIESKLKSALKKISTKIKRVKLVESSKKRSVKVISDSKFLRREFRRLWNLK